MGTTFALCLLFEKYRREAYLFRVLCEFLWWAFKEKSVLGKYVELIRAIVESHTYVWLAASNTLLSSMFL